MNRETGTKILLIGSFAASLVLPTLVYPAVRSHLDQQNYENRELASFPELSAANFDNIPTEFEAYYNDHVPFKNLFVKAKTKLDLELLNESSISDVTVGKEKLAVLHRFGGRRGCAGGLSADKSLYGG